MIAPRQSPLTRNPQPTLTAQPPAAPETTVAPPAIVTSVASSAEATDLPTVDDWLEPERLTSTLKTVAILSIFSLAPAVLLMTTSYVRVTVVLGLLRQGLGPQVLPSNQIVSTLAIFLTVVIMGPVWKQAYDDAIVPYTQGELGLEETWQAGVEPVRQFMTRQIELNGNQNDVLMFQQYMNGQNSLEPAPVASASIAADTPLTALLPAFMLSELKTAFLIGFQIYLPFLIIDIVVSSVTVSMGMVMLPPSVVSMPFKLLLFVLVDGWHLVAQMLLQSFSVFT